MRYGHGLKMVTSPACLNSVGPLSIMRCGDRQAGAQKMIAICTPRRDCVVVSAGLVTARQHRIGLRCLSDKISRAEGWMQEGHASKLTLQCQA